MIIYFWGPGCRHSGNSHLLEGASTGPPVPHRGASGLPSHGGGLEGAPICRIFHQGFQICHVDLVESPTVRKFDLCTLLVSPTVRLPASAGVAAGAEENEFQRAGRIPQQAEDNKKGVYLLAEAGKPFYDAEIPLAELPKLLVTDLHLTERQPLKAV